MRLRRSASEDYKEKERIMKENENENEENVAEEKVRVRGRETSRGTSVLVHLSAA